MISRNITISVLAPEDVDVAQVLFNYITEGIELDKSLEDDGNEEAIRRLAIVWGEISSDIGGARHEGS
jgi:hypothetical protein